MKTCPHCKEVYPDEVVICPLDGTVLSANLGDALLDEDDEVTSVDRVISGRLHGLISDSAPASLEPEPFDFSEDTRDKAKASAQPSGERSAASISGPVDGADLDEQATGVLDVSIGRENREDGSDLCQPAEISHVTVRKLANPVDLARLRRDTVVPPRDTEKTAVVDLAEMAEANAEKTAVVDLAEVVAKAEAAKAKAAKAKVAKAEAAKAEAAKAKAEAAKVAKAEVAKAKAAKAKAAKAKVAKAEAAKAKAAKAKAAKAKAAKAKAAKAKAESAKAESAKAEAAKAEAAKAESARARAESAKAARAKAESAKAAKVPMAAPPVPSSRGEKASGEAVPSSSPVSSSGGEKASGELWSSAKSSVLDEAHDTTGTNLSLSKSIVKEFPKSPQAPKRTGVERLRGLSRIEGRDPSAEKLTQETSESPPSTEAVDPGPDAIELPALDVGSSYLETQATYAGPALSFTDLVPDHTAEIVNVPPRRRRSWMPLAVIAFLATGVVVYLWATHTFSPSSGHLEPLSPSSRVASPSSALSDTGPTRVPDVSVALDATRRSAAVDAALRAVAVDAAPPRNDAAAKPAADVAMPARIVPTRRSGRFGKRSHSRARRAKRHHRRQRIRRHRRRPSRRRVVPRSKPSVHRGRPRSKTRKQGETIDPFAE